MRYRKKAVEIEAVQFRYSEEGIKLVKEFAGDAIVMWSKERHPDAIGKLTIATLEGNMVASEGDFIIKGVKGEFYSCREDIFHMTYEKVE